MLPAKMNEPDRSEGHVKDMAEVLDATRRIWSSGDGLEYQFELRSEWQEDLIDHR